ncbi:MAG: DoxX family protein [Pseudomonadota bacterium]
MLTIGRILFAVLFIVSGGLKLFNIPETVKMVASKVLPVPAFAADYVKQLEEAVGGIEFSTMLAVAAGSIELVCGLLIALNFGSRFFAIILALFVVVATFYGHPFWSMPAGDAQTNETVHALKNLSLIGGLLMIAGLPRSSRQSDPSYPDV